MPPRARSELNTIIEPSGAKEGSRLFRLSWVIRTGAPPDICRTQMSKPPLPAKSDAYARRLAPGDRDGAVARPESEVSRVNTAPVVVAGWLLRSQPPATLSNTRRTPSATAARDR